LHGSPHPTIKKEVVRNEADRRGRDRGGISAVFTKPDYQNAVACAAVNPHVIGRAYRMSPAVGSAKPASIHAHQWQHLDTSAAPAASAPLWQRWSRASIKGSRRAAAF